MHHPYFMLDEAKASRWVTSDSGTVAETWSPANDPEADAVVDLAQDEGVLRAPEGAAITYVDLLDGEEHLWLLDLPGVRLASERTRWRGKGEGATAVLELLREAARTANGLIVRNEAYLAAQIVRRDPELGYRSVDVQRALSTATEMVIEAYGSYEGPPVDAANLTVNVAMHVLEHPGASIEEAIESNYDEDDSPSIVIGWLHGRDA